MVRLYINCLILFMTVILLFSCDTSKVIVNKNNVFDNNTVQVPYGNNIENFMVIIDASASMSVYYKGFSKLNIAREILYKINQEIPKAGFNAAIRTFGRSLWPLGKKTDLIYGLEKYSKKNFKTAINKISWSGGKSPLDNSINAANIDLRKTTGKIALVIITDGLDMDDSTIFAAESIANHYKNRICVYTVMIGNNPKGARVMNSIVKSVGCGLSVNADDLDSKNKLNAFTQRIFNKHNYTKGGDRFKEELSDIMQPESFNTSQPAPTEKSNIKKQIPENKIKQPEIILDTKQPDESIQTWDEYPLKSRLELNNYQAINCHGLS